MASISLNADLGEGFGPYRIADDETLLGLVTDANVACGFHGGDPDIMRATCETAARNGVGIGAHPGFRDLIGFGRRFQEISRDSLANDILYQLGAIAGFARASGQPISYLKAHGALYHAAVEDDEYAHAVVDAILRFDAELPFLCQPGTSFSALAQSRGITCVREGFIDRAYRPDGLLVSRTEPGAVISDVDAAAERAVQMATEGTVRTLSGELIDLPVDSVCIHSDSPGAVDMARAVRGALESAGVTLAPIAG